LLELHFESSVVFLKLLVSSLEFFVPFLEGFDLLPLAFTRRLGSAAVAKNSLHTTLFLFIISLSSFSASDVSEAAHDVARTGSSSIPRGKICLGLGKDLAPRLSFLGGLLFRGRR
jgi:hypothetical protein